MLRPKRNDKPVLFKLLEHIDRGLEVSFILYCLMEFGLACSKTGAAGLEVSKDTRPGAASSDGRSTAENSENGGVHGLGTVVFTVSA